MGNIQDSVGEQPQPNGGGMRRVMNDSSESISELREFMSNLRGKNPQEVLGQVANSSLVQSTMVSAIGFLVVIVGLSVTTHYWKQAFAGEQPAVAEAAESEAPANASDAADSLGDNQPADSSGDADAATGDATVTTKSGDPTLDNLGIGDAKAADPKKNPLEDSLDNLLDGAN